MCSRARTDGYEDVEARVETPPGSTKVSAERLDEMWMEGANSATQVLTL